MAFGILHVFLEKNLMAMNDNEKDILLWNRFRDGCTEPFVIIFRNYYSQLFNYGYKITNSTTLVEDAIQELFIDLWRSKGKAEIVSLKAYLFKALKFKLIKSINKAGKTNFFFSETDEHEFELSHEMFLIEGQDNQELSQKVFNAMQKLSVRQKEIIYLKFHQNLSYEEVSEIMHINYQAARNLVYQSIKVLKKIIVILIICETLFVD
jgi:RNA polymerase sigma-70 factor (ECF subfamily)